MSVASQMTKSNHALVTGATSGAGYAMARRLVSLGYRVSVNGLLTDGSKDDFLMSFGASDRVRFAEADLRDPEALETMVVEAKKEFGPISVLINSAGIRHLAPVEDCSPEMWDSVMAINLSATFHTMRLTVPDMKDMGWGRIINLASAHAQVGSPFESAYVAAKHGVLGLTKAVALEVAKHNVTCVALCPGHVKSALLEKRIPEMSQARGMSSEEVIREVLLASQPTGKFVTHDQLADTMAFLLTDGACNITGTALTLDGGWTAH